MHKVFNGEQCGAERFLVVVAHLLMSCLPKHTAGDQLQNTVSSATVTTLYIRSQNLPIS